jgi:hypothetical protein
MVDFIRVAVMKRKLVPCLLMGALVSFGCGPDTVAASGDDAGTKAEESSEETSSEETSPGDLPPDDPRWCIEQVEGAEVQYAMTELEIECAAELTAEGCAANPVCTAVFGRGIQCPDSGACATEPVEFLGCVPFTVCKPGTAIYCREMQGYLLTYVSMQGDCTPFGMMDCRVSPDYTQLTEPVPDCD